MHGVFGPATPPKLEHWLQVTGYWMHWFSHVPILSLADQAGIVCGVDGVTYPSTAAAASAGAAVLNCGHCGACSTQQDLAVYLRTAANLTVAVRACGLVPLRSQQEACLLRIGLSVPCAACFQANIDCDRRHCLRPCLAGLLASWLQLLRAWATGFRTQPPKQGLATSECLACDEAHCGPAFLACAGANRRRAGIVSDIARDEAELCKVAVAYRSAGVGKEGHCNARAEAEGQLPWDTQ